MKRGDWLRRIEQLDPERDHHEIYRIMVAHEFPWDMNQSLSFALFRTYAVPSIGALLARTGEFERRTQKRYEDTALILDAVLEHGVGSVQGRAAIRRMNQMHGTYAISNDDMRYVLSAFVVMPIEWLDSYGWRPLTEREKVASANYYRVLGRQMNIKDLPATWQDFRALLQDYERAHFGFDPGGRAVAEATLALLRTLPPSDKLPALFVRQLSLALMDEPLLDAFGFAHPRPFVRAVVRTGLKARARVVRLLPPRAQPLHARDFPTIRGYANGYDIADLGTFPRQAEG